MTDERLAHNETQSPDSDSSTATGTNAANAGELAAAGRISDASARRAALASRRNNLSASKRALLEKRLRGEGSADVIRVPRIGRRDQSIDPPLSFAQERLWFLDQLNPNNASYNMPTAARVTGPLNIDVLERALGEIVRRHEVLRTTFRSDRGQPFQSIRPPEEQRLQVEDLSHLPTSRRDRRARQRAAEEAKQPFDLENGPLLRALVLRLDEEDHVVLFCVHHIVFDGWSAAIFLRELGTNYAAFSQDAPSPLADLPIQYADYSVWQRDWLSGDVLERQLSYWREQLADAPTLDLPSDHHRPEVPSLRGARHSFRLPRELRRAVQTLCEREGATLFMAMLGGFQALLARYSGQDDIATGSPIAGRQRTELEGLIGFFVNTLVLRTNLSGDPSFRELLRRAREICLGAYAHQDVPFEKLVQELQPERSVGRAPLFQVLFVLQNTPSAAVDAPGGLRMRRIGQAKGTAKFDLELTAGTTDDHIWCTFEYALDLFEAATIERMSGHFAKLLEEAVNSPDVPMSRLGILTARERQELLCDWNQTESAIRSVCAHELVAQQVERTPNANAVVFEDTELTYGELNRRGNRLAARLRSLGVGPDVKVGVCAKRSLDLIVGLLGILKAGGAYVPLDPEYPIQRHKFVLSDAAIDVLLTQRNLSKSVGPTRTRVVEFEEDTPAGAEYDENPQCNADPDNLAYVLYTSGSTGTPKGIEMTHRCLSNLLSWQRQNSSGSSAPTTLQFASSNFDVSFQEIFSTLATGGTLVLLDENTRHDPEKLLQLIHRRSVERLFIPFVALQHLAAWAAESGWPECLREVITAGEQLRITEEISSAFGASSDCRLQNQYGPTESHVVTSHSLDGRPDDWPELPPIGRPITNTRTYILDEWMNPVGVGLPGELHIGGQPLARGYVGRPAATAERFVPNPFAETPGERLYKTGDLCRWRGNGEIEYLGRADHQVKVRGFRVELAEVESMLSRHPDVREAIVVSREDRPHNHRLVAYLVPDGDRPPSVTQLRKYLESGLPDYMIPAAYVTLEALPLSPNGKVDRKALPQPDGTRPAIETQFVQPCNEVEEQLATIFSNVLDVERVGVHDDFFELGGYSLLATEVAFRIRQALGRSLPLAALFSAPTISQLAQRLEHQEKSESVSCIVELHAAGDALPVFCVQPAGADVTPYRHLADALAPLHPVYGVRDVPSGRRDFATFDEMGAEYAHVIRKQQPQGPYCVLGWSAGAALAVSIAAAIEREHQQVALVGILDGGLRTQAREVNPIEVFDVQLKSGGFLPKTFNDMTSPERQEFLDDLKQLSMREQFERVVAWASDHGREVLPPSVSWEAIEDDARNTAMHMRLFSGYTPPIIRAPLHVWWAKDNRANRRTVDWQRYTHGKVHPSDVPGDHVSFLEPPGAEVIADQLQEALGPLNSEN